jgi:hypothetical protein
MPHVLAGLPEPRVNLIIRGRDGGWLRRYDLAYEHFRLIIEYDGRQHAEDTQQWLTDIFRREELDQMRCDWRLSRRKASTTSLCGHWSGYEMRCSSAEPSGYAGLSSRSGVYTSHSLTRAVSRWQMWANRARLTLAGRLETGNVS